MMASRNLWVFLHSLGALPLMPCGMRVSRGDRAGHELGSNSTQPDPDGHATPSGTWSCPPEGFSSISAEKLEAQGGVASYVSGRWFVQLQQEVTYVPREKNFCVSAEYAERPPPRNPLTLPWWRYDIDVSNYAETEAGVGSGGPLCSKIISESNGQLAVAPCFLPSTFAGPYWILDYDELQGYALISGGAPANQGEEEGTCKPGSGVNNAGMWVFTRCPNPSSELVEEVLRIARDQFKLDVSALNPVRHHPQCRYGLGDEDHEALRGVLAQRGCTAEDNA